MRLGVVFFDSIYQPTGAGKVVRSFVSEKNLFIKENIEDVTVYSRDNESTQSENVSTNGPSRGLKRLIKSFLVKTYIGCCFTVYYTGLRKGKKIINKLVSKDGLENDIFIFHDLYSCYYFVQYCKKKCISKKFVLVEHTNGETWKMLYMYYPRLKDTKFSKFLEKLSYECEEKASRIVFVSNVSADNYKKGHSEFSKKVAVIPNGIEPRTEKVPIRNYEKLNLITVGTVNIRKNQKMIIEAISRLKDKNIDLTVVGAGDKLQECKDIASSLNVNDKISFLGTRNDVEELLDNSNIFVLASYDEGLPIAAIEALKSGLPLVITDVGGCRELISNNGILIKPEINELIDALSNLYGKTDLLKNMSQESYKLFTEKYSIDSMMKKYSDMAKLVYFGGE